MLIKKFNSFFLYQTSIEGIWHKTYRETNDEEKCFQLTYDRVVAQCRQ